MLGTSVDAYIERLKQIVSDDFEGPPPFSILLATDAQGIYGPRYAAVVALNSPGVTINKDDRRTLEAFSEMDPTNPDLEWYWEEWDAICNNVTVKLDGQEYAICQDGDVWLWPTDWTSRLDKDDIEEAIYTDTLPEDYLDGLY